MESQIICDSGIYGFLLSYGLTLFFFGSALLVFLYLWCKKRLDFDETPKWQMMEDQEAKRDQKEEDKP